MNTPSFLAISTSVSFNAVGASRAVAGFFSRVSARGARKRVSASLRRACRVVVLKRNKGLGLALLVSLGTALGACMPANAAYGVHISAKASAGACLSTNDPDPRFIPCTQTRHVGVVEAGDRPENESDRKMGEAFDLAMNAHAQAVELTGKQGGFGPDEKVADRIDEVKLNLLMWDPTQSTYSAVDASVAEDRIPTVAAGPVRTNAANKGQRDVSPQSSRDARATGAGAETKASAAHGSAAPNPIVYMAAGQARPSTLHRPRTIATW